MIIVTIFYNIKNRFDFIPITYCNNLINNDELSKTDNVFLYFIFNFQYEIL